MSGLELPKGVEETSQDPKKIPTLEGTICWIRSAQYSVPTPGLAPGAVTMHGGSIDIPCRTDCAAYVPSNRKNKPGECAVLSIARSLRTLSNQAKQPERPTEGKVTL